METVASSRNRASEIVGNANFGEIDTLLSQGHDMEYIARRGIITSIFHFVPLCLCPFEPFLPHKRILGAVGRTLLIPKRIMRKP